MKRVTVILNPRAGGGFPASLQHQIVRALTARGFDVQVERTTAAPGSATNLARQAGKASDLVLACGGDGTVHEVLQGLAGTEAVLGVLPLGTANALARNLGLPTSPLLAIDALLTFQPQTIPLGLAQTGTSKRWFIVMAGAGPDGRLLQEMRPAIKARFGRRGYYVEAARIFLTRRFPAFHVEYRVPGSTTWHARAAVAMMASRVPDLGGLFRGLTPTARLHQSHLLVHLLSAPAHVALPAWMLLGKMRLAHTNPWLTVLAVQELRCTPIACTSDLYAQVDGEPAGPLPMTLTIVPAVLRLLMPRASAQHSAFLPAAPRQ